MTLNRFEGNTYDGGTLPEVVVTGEKSEKRIKLDTHQVDVNQMSKDTVDSIKKKDENVSEEARNELDHLMKKKEDDLVDKYLLETLLKEKIQEKVSNILLKIKSNDIKELYKNAKTDGERRALDLLFKEYETKNVLEKQRLEEIRNTIKETQRELKYFLQGQVMEQTAYKVENLRASNIVEATSNVSDTKTISEEEMKTINTFLDGKGVLTDKLTRVERGLKSDFRKMLQILGERASLKDILGTLTAQEKSKITNPDWNQLLPKENNKKYTEKELKTLENGYLSYLESKTSNPDLSRWNQVLNTLATGILNEGKSLDTIRTESLNKPISKKESKQGLLDEEWKYRTQFAENGKAQEWMNTYLQQNTQEIQAMQQMWRENGYSGAQINTMTKGYIESKFDAYTGKEWKNHLKDLEKNGIQKSDLGKFRVLVDGLNNKSDQDRMLALMTDTNFDGMRNHLDGRGTKRGLQVDAAFYMALESGETPEEIVKNIGAFMEIRNPAVKAPTENVKAFADWLGADITNARAVQSALMDSPAQAVDIMTHGKDALKKTLEKNNFAPEDLQKIQNKIDTDPATKDLPAATRAELMSSTSSYLLSKMQEKGANASVNGLGVGVNVPLSQILEGLSFTAGTGTNFDGGLFAGIGLAWNTKVATWETGHIDAGVKAGTTLGVIPIYGLRAGLEQDVNTKAVLGDLDPTALKSVSFGANVTMIGALPSWGLNAGFDADKLKGIEKQYNNIKKDGLQMMKDLLATDKSVDAVKDYLAKKYKNTDQDSLNKAAENLASALKLADGLDANAAAKVISDWYADSWRNTAIQGLPKGRKPTGAGIGIQFLAGFFPVGSLSMTLTKYKNESYEDSPESKQALRQRVEKGIGNEIVNKVQKADFDKIASALKKSNILAAGESLEMSDDGFVFISTSLLNKAGLEVNIADHLKGYIKQADKTLILPANIDWRFLEAKRTNGTTAVLNIGGNKNEGMQLLTAQNLKDYVGEKDYSVELQKNQISSALEAIKAKNPELANLKVSFEKNQIVFLNGEEQVGPYELGKPIDQEFAVGEGGKFTIKLYQTGGIDVQRESASSGKFVEFVYDKAGNEKELNLTQTNKLLASLRDSNSDLVKSLSSLDDKKLTALNGFLENTKATKADYEQAIKELKVIIPNEAPYENLWKFLSTTAFGDGKIALDDKYKNNTISRLAVNVMNDIAASRYLIVDRLKAIFATESRIKDVNSMRAVVNSRNNVYQKLAGPNGKTMAALNIDSKEFAKTIENTDKVLVPGLIGFTAFYRRGTNTGRGLSLTGLGETNVLGGKMQRLTAEQETFAKEWFFGPEGTSGNLDKYSTQKALLTRKVREVAGIQNLSNTQVESLLKGESIDIGEKIFKLNIEYVFYLMGECANESLGLNIKGIKVLDKITGEVVSQGSMTVNRSETDAKASIDSRKVNVGVSVGGGEREKPGTTPKEEEIPGTTPGEQEVPITPSKTPETPEQPPQGGGGQDTEQEEGRD